MVNVKELAIDETEYFIDDWPVVYTLGYWLIIINKLLNPIALNEVLLV